MPDYPNTVADTSAWKPLPVTAEDATLICQGLPIRLTFKTARDSGSGFVLAPGKAVRLKSGNAGFIAPADAHGGIAVIEVFG